MDLRELDAEIAVKVFGFTMEKTPKDYHGNFGDEDILLPPGGPRDYVYPPSGRIPLTWHVPSWSSHLSDAWPLVTLLNSVDVEVCIGMFPQQRCSVELRRWRDRRDEGIAGDPTTGRSRETFVLKIGDEIAVTICRAIACSGLKLNFR